MKTRFPTFDAELVAQIEDHLDMHYLTEITEQILMDESDGDLMIVFANGWTRKSYPRPMFQLIPDAVGRATAPGVPCNLCGDFSRSWSCPDHTKPRPPSGIRSIDLSSLPSTVPDALIRAYGEMYARTLLTIQRSSITIVSDHFGSCTVYYELEEPDASTF